MTRRPIIFDEHIISRDRIRPRPDGVPGARLDLRLPWYRGLPLSCVERLEISIDGESIPANDITLSLYGYQHELDELPALHDVVWFTLDTADVRVRTAAPLAQGDHQVDVTIQARIPYVSASAGWKFAPVAQCSKVVPMVDEDAW
jgi:Domain of unknown function (DUF6379)